MKQKINVINYFKNFNKDISKKNLKEYLAHPKKFIFEHSNKENFINIFSNFTKTDGNEILNDYLVNNHELQILIDKLNNFQNNNINNWEFDIQKKKFILPDESKNFSYIS